VPRRVEAVAGQERHARLSADLRRGLREQRQETYMLMGPVSETIRAGTRTPHRLDVRRGCAVALPPFHDR